MGPDIDLTNEGETVIKDWCTILAKCGFTLKMYGLLNTVHNIVSKEKKAQPFYKQSFWKKWYKSSLKRSPELTERTPENISKGRAVVTEVVC